MITTNQKQGNLDRLASVLSGGKADKPVVFKQKKFDRRRKLADAMMGAGTKYEPIQSHWQGIAKLVQAYLGGKMHNDADREEGQYWDEQRENKRKLYESASNAGSVDEAIQILMGNTDTADEGFGMWKAQQGKDPVIHTDAKGRKRRADGSFLFEEMEGYDPDLLSPEALAQKEQLAKAGSTKVNTIVGGQQQTKGRDAVDEEYAKQFAQDRLSGGLHDTEKNLSQLKEAHDALGDDSKNLTGPGVHMMPDLVNSIINPEAIATREAVEEVVQRNLRLVLGSQFTEKEGERLIARAYNTRLPEEENRKRVGRLYEAMKKAYQTKMDAANYFQQHGTMTGWEGKLPTIADLHSAIEGEAENPVSGQYGSPVDGAKQANDGKWYVPDPNRPGKYLEVRP